MKTATLIDSGCHLPNAFCQKYHISYVPVHYSVDDTSFVDECLDSNALAMFESGALSLDHDVHVRAPSEQEYAQAIISKIKQGYDRIFVQTASQNFSDSYQNARAGILRAKAKIGNRPIAMRAIDSHSMQAGQALTVTELSRRLLRSPDPAILQYEVEKLATKVHTFSFVKDPMYTHERGLFNNHKKIDWAVSFVSSKISLHSMTCMVKENVFDVKKILGFQKACEAFFELLVTHIQRDLLSPVVVINYCGSLEELKMLPGFKSLYTVSKAKKIMLIPAVASLAEFIQSGSGSISVALAPKENIYDEDKH